MNRIKKTYARLNPENRIYELKRPVIGLTGGIASGKSTVSKLLKEKGLQIIDADGLVKSIYETEEAKSFISSQFPEAWENKINFKILRDIAFKNPEAKSKIENFIYARLPEAFKKAADKIEDQDFYVYDVPLLFEKKLEIKVDLTVVVYAPRSIQLRRLLARDGTSIEVANSILDQQMNIEEKKKKADFVIENSGPMEKLAAEVQDLLLQILDDH